MRYRCSLSQTKSLKNVDIECLKKLTDLLRQGSPTGDKIAQSSAEFGFNFIIDKLLGQGMLHGKNFSRRAFFIDFLMIVFSRLKRPVEYFLFYGALHGNLFEYAHLDAVEKPWDRKDNGWSGF